MNVTEHCRWGEARKYDSDQANWNLAADGGLVHVRAKVHPTAKVFAGALVFGGEIRGGEIHGGVIRGGVVRGGEIRGGEIWGGVIWGGAIHGGVISRSPILIYGSRYWIGWAGEIDGESVIASGCITRPVTWWLEHVERCAAEHGYSEAEQKEYRMHVEHIAAWLRRHGLLKPNQQ